MIKCSFLIRLETANTNTLCDSFFAHRCILQRKKAINKSNSTYAIRHSQKLVGYLSLGQGFRGQKDPSHAISDVHNRMQLNTSFVSYIFV